MKIDGDELDWEENAFRRWVAIVTVLVSAATCKQRRWEDAGTLCVDRNECNDISACVRIRVLRDPP